MKKPLIALCATLACTTAAHAQSTVTIAGTFDSYVGSVKTPGQTSATSMVGSGGMTTSWIGFKGTEDLGNGLKVNFNLTSFFRGDTGESGRFNGDTLYSRDANVGLSGNFGTVLLGRWMAPNFLPSVVGNPFGDSFTVSPLILHKDVNNTGWQNRTTASDTGWSNQIAYTTPTFNGFKATVQYQFGEQQGQNSKGNLGANFFYFGGPLTLTGFYERNQVSNPVSSVLPSSRNYWMLLGAYDFGVIKPFLSYGQVKIDSFNGTTDSAKGKTFQVGASVPTSDNGKVLASYVQTNYTGALENKRKTFSIGYDHNLSKRTDVYAVFMRDKVDVVKTGDNNGRTIIAGIRHRF